MKNKLLFLGGSTDKTLGIWRSQYLTELSEYLDMFDPVVSNWTPNDQKVEDEMRLNADYLLFVINGNNTFSIAELIDCSNKRPETTIMVLDLNTIETLKSARIKSVKAIAKMAELNGVKVFYNHTDAINYFKTV